MVQLSTDFVFDGSKNRPYSEQDATNPLSVYGRSKLKGEILVAEALKEHFILRTSWLYSLEGHNFLKTMLKLGKDRDTLNVVNDQRGTPTYAGDLADVILHIIETGNKNYGLYHYSNEGSATWYEFAKSIFELANITVDLQPINTEEYPTPAKRPAYSVLDKSKVKTELRASVPEWEESLGKLLQPEKYSNCSA